MSSAGAKVNSFDCEEIKKSSAALTRLWRSFGGVDSFTVHQVVPTDALAATASLERISRIADVGIDPILATCD
jgi:hypothetical protein